MAFECRARQVKWAYRPLHVLPIRLWFKGAIHYLVGHRVPRWNFGFFASAKMRAGQEVSACENFRCGSFVLLASWTKVPWRKTLASLSAFEGLLRGLFSQRAQDFRVAGIFPPFSGVTVNWAAACGGTAEILPSLNGKFPIRKRGAHSSRALNKLAQVVGS
jgi:hypothetical protein